MMRTRALLLLAALAAPLGAQQPRLTTPKEALGFDVGADYQLANYTQLLHYWQTLAKESPRMILDTIGLSAEGRPQVMAILSSPENLAKLGTFRQTSEQLARGRVDEATARRLAAAGKTVVWIDGGLHATEVLGAQQLLELVWQFVSQNDPETLRILRDCIILAVQVNPDGMELVSDWYMRNPDTLRRSMGNLPRLYEKYAGHDDNRDFYRNALPETQNDSRIQYRTWYPQIIYNHHQTGPAGSVMFTPPFRDPFNYVFDPMVPTSLDMVAMGMQRRFAEEGKGGIVSKNASSYSTWWNGGLRTAGYFHNMIGILTEAIGSPTPTTIPIRLERQLPSGDGYLPVQWGPWHFRQSIDYEMTANRAILDFASRYREDLLLNFWRMGRNSIERGQTDTWTATPALIEAARQAGSSQEAMAAALRDPARRDPRAYVIPAGQAEMGPVLDFVNALSTSGIEIHKATASFAIKGTSYPKGSFVIRADQAFRPHVLDMFEPQWHPMDLEYPGGPPKRPYDNAGYTLAFQMGFQFDRILDPFQAPIAEITQERIVPDPVTVDARASAWRLSAASTESFLAVNRLTAANQQVERLPNGDFVVPGSPTSARILAELGRDRALAATPWNGARGTPVKPLRIGLFDQYGGSMESGWTRWIFEHYEMPYTVVFPPRLDAGDLRKDFDVILFVGSGIPGIGGGGRGFGGGAGRGGRGNAADTTAGGRGAGGRAGGAGRGGGAADIPAEYQDQVGRVTAETTIPQLKAFLEQGGRIAAISSSALNLAQHLGLPIESQLTRKQPDGSTRPIPSSEYYIPGSVLEVAVDSTQPEAAGAHSKVDVFFDNSPVFRLLPGWDTRGIRKIAWFSAPTPLRSGWAIGQDFLKDGAEMVAAPVGEGTAYLYAPEMFFRAQPEGTFRFVFNVLYGNR